MSTKFSKKYSTVNDVEIYDSTNTMVKKGWISISISYSSISVYISRDNNRIYWIGNKQKSKSAKLKLKFNNKTNVIRINSSKIVFNSISKYNEIKNKIIKFGYMDEDENLVTLG